MTHHLKLKWCVFCFFLWKKSLLIQSDAFPPSLLRCRGRSVQFSHSVLSDSLPPHGLQHARPPCPSPIPGVCSNSCPLSQWCHPTISSSVTLFSSCLQSFWHHGSFFFFIFILFYFLPLQYCIGFAIYQHESTTGIHVFPILNPPSSSLSIPSVWVVPVHQPQASSIVHRTWTGVSFHIWYCTCFNAILPNLPTLSLSHRVQKTVLYICVSFAVSHTGLLLPSF